MAELPEPLPIVLRQVASLMVEGTFEVATVNRGGEAYDYSEVLDGITGEVTAFLTEQVRHRSNGSLELREVAAGASSVGKYFVEGWAPYFFFMTYPPGRPNELVNYFVISVYEGSHEGVLLQRVFL